MKKVLFATTALVATAGMMTVAPSAANADIALSGSAEMGILGGNAKRFGVFNRGQFHTDIDVTFTMSGETDHGITFGASVDLDEADDSGGTFDERVIGVDLNGDGDTNDRQVSIISSNTFGPTTQGGETIFVSGVFGTLTMGDTDGAFDWAHQETDIGGGAINDDHTTHSGFFGGAALDGAADGQIARWDYTFGDFSFALSAEIDDSGGPAVGINGRSFLGTPYGLTGSTIYGAGAKYSLALNGATIDFGAGYQTSWNVAWYGGSIYLSMDNGFGAVINGSVVSAPNPFISDGYLLGAGVAYTYDALTASVNWGGAWFAGPGNDRNGWGGQVSYDLGGGFELQAGVGSGNRNGTSYSFGAAMSF